MVSFVERVDIDGNDSPLGLVKGCATDVREWTNRARLLLQLGHSRQCAIRPGDELLE
jgi:hypothetical protein